MTANKGTTNKRERVASLSLAQQKRRLGGWEFAREFPALLRANLETHRRSESLPRALVGKLGEARLRVWEREGAHPSEVEELYSGHLTVFLDVILSLAASVAHEIVTGEHLAAFEDAVFLEIENRRKVINIAFRGCILPGIRGERPSAEGPTP